MNTDLPVAAIVCLAVGSYLLLVVIVLVTRYFLVSRGICKGDCPCTPDEENAGSCVCCRNISESCNCCQMGDATSCLNVCCPNPQAAKGFCQRLSCIDLVLCQCCGSQGSEGLCNCFRPCKQCVRPSKCPVCVCLSECPRWKWDHACTSKCFCLTVHLTCDRSYDMSHDRLQKTSHDHTSFSKVMTLTHPVDASSTSSMPKNAKLKKFLSFTDLNDNILPENVSLRLPYSVSENHYHQITQPHTNDQKTTENNVSSTNCTSSYLPSLTNNQLVFPTHKCRHFVRPGVMSSKVTYSESFTQTPRLIPVRRTTLHKAMPRHFITASDRYVSISAKIYHSKNRTIFHNRICKGFNFQKNRLHDVGNRHAKTFPMLSKGD